MMIVRKGIVAAVFTCVVMWAGVTSAQQKAPEHPALSAARDHLYKGTLQEGERQIAGMAEKEPNSPETAFALGTIRTAVAIERFGQGLTRYGFKTRRAGGYIPINLPIQPNKPVEDISHDLWNRMLIDLVADLDKAQDALKIVGDKPVAFSLEPVKVRFDFNNDGKASDDESLWAILGADPRTKTVEDEKFSTIVFDSADAAWLRGYDNLAIAKAQILLGYDTSLSFPYFKELFFLSAKPQSSLDDSRYGRQSFTDDLIPIIAMVHTIRWPVADSKRLADAHARLKEMIAMRRLSWRLIGSRQDKEVLRWIPGPGQKGVLEMEVSADMVSGWKTILDRTEDMLDGKVLAPFPEWMKKPSHYGLNIRRMFLEPKEFDLVLFMTGYGAAPFIERGQVLSAEEWGGAARAFGGQMLFYALWFN